MFRLIEFAVLHIMRVQQCKEELLGLGAYLERGNMEDRACRREF